MLPVLKFFSALALALWLGGMIFFATSIAPVAFSVLPTREMAGNVVNGVMRNLHFLAFGAGSVLLVTFALRAMLGHVRLMPVKALLALVMLGIALYSQFGVSAPLAEMRREIGSIDRLAPEDPMRVRFGDMHRLSVALMGVNILLAVAVLALEQVPEA